MARKVALVIGNSEYRDAGLSRLGTPGADVRYLARVLQDPLTGCFDEVRTLDNPESAEARREVARLFSNRTRDDLVLLYFSGHGVLDEHGELHLAVCDTEREMVSATGVAAKFVSEQMDRSNSRKAVLILDCCHAGAFARGSKGAVGGSVGTKTAFEGTGQGRIVLTATDATQYAFEGEQVTGGGQPSVFTRHLIEGLASGAADTDGDGLVSVDELYDYVQERVIHETPKQTPMKWSYGQKGLIPLTINPNPRPAELPAEIRELMRSPQTASREGVVRDLTTLARTGDRSMVAATRMALEKLAEDDSRRVSDAARAALVQMSAAVTMTGNPTGPWQPGQPVHQGGGIAAGPPSGPAYPPPNQGWQPASPAAGQQGYVPQAQGYGSPQQGPQQSYAAPPPRQPGPPAAVSSTAPSGSGAPAAPIEPWVLIVLAIFVPPIAIYLKEKTSPHFWVSITLMVLGFFTFGLTWLGAIPHALWVVLRKI